VVVVSGHHPTTTVKTVLNLLSNNVLGLAQEPADVGAHLRLVLSAMAASDPPRHVFVLLHGIDGKGLRGRANQVPACCCAALTNYNG
jgi:hypothetical protein